MKYTELRRQIKSNVFTTIDVMKFFPIDSPHTVKIQLSRFSRRGLVTGIKRGWYCFDPEKVDVIDLSGQLYQPSYVSLETALNYYGVIPDIPQMVTAVTTTTTKHIKSALGTYVYAKIKPELFFGFRLVKSIFSDRFIKLAIREKALLDYFYIRKIKLLDDLRLNLSEMNIQLYNQYKKYYPGWIPEIKA